MKLTQTVQFRKDAKRLVKRGQDVEKLLTVVRLLRSRDRLPEPLRDHPRAGGWRGWRDCNFEPDWVLIYRISGDELILGRTGSHSD
ncbi:MAG: type II toxin-antitoxin system YafQ family toxin [Verrucomicrobiae bacterium]|nr:type II toxin-antitoxin system YafQ family toxin [Verrucomicrobiae bacterium]MCP5522220.1 type II toxin-antitoxin system YafQ family toxin [Verrucomicrobiales bacterium]